MSLITVVLLIVFSFLIGFILCKQKTRIRGIKDLSEKKIYELEGSSFFDFHGKKVGLVRDSLDGGDGKLVFVFLPDYVFRNFGVHEPFRREGNILVKHKFEHS